jgi:hypothetical protein
LDKAAESTEIQEQIQAVRIEISAKDQDVREMNNGISATVMHNQGVERENENVKYSITEQQERRQMQQSTIY